MSDLETMLPEPVTVTAGGKTITLKPVTMRQLQPAIRAALPILHALKSGQLDISKLKGMDMLAWAEAYAEHGNALSEMIAHLAGVSVAELGDWTPDEVLVVASQAMRVNTDFFTSLARQIGTAGAMGAAKAQAMASTGPTASSD